jgi:uncharacterized protein
MNTPIPLPERETRFLTGEVELRAAAETEKPRIRGYAAKFSTESEPLGKEGRQFIEVISRGAFDEVLGDDVRALFNHDPNQILARSKNGAGTLTLGTDETGLFYEFEAPDTQAGRDLMENIRLGNVDQSSFGFSVRKEDQKWDERQTESGESLLIRTIHKVARLFDVSPVTYPAYPDATVALRSLQEFRESEPLPPEPTEDHSIAHRQRALALHDKTAI